MRHGDTLWAIANMFLRDPWTWPEIWYVNPQIKNPHRIYPGDQLQLALGSNGRMALKLVRTLATTAAAPGSPNARLRPLLRSSPLDTPIETIPYSIIGAFLSHPTVLSTDQIHAAPYVVALMENHNIAGTGHEIFIKQATGEAGARYSVMHVDQELINPENGHHLGYMAIYTGTAELTQAGPISKAVLTDSARETLQGDVLIPEDHAPVADFVPHVPERPVSGRIIAVVDNVLLAGQDQVVAINRGSDDGLERGHVLDRRSGPDHRERSVRHDREQQHLLRAPVGNAADRCGRDNARVPDVRAHELRADPQRHRPDANRRSRPHALISHFSCPRRAMLAVR